MAGILDSKKRIFDTILTPEGRKQLAEGTFRARYYSFTDRSTFYNRDTIVSGGLDETFRFVTEASALLQDQIALESDDSGHVKALIKSGSVAYSVLDGRLFSLTGSGNGPRQLITGSDFTALSTELLSSSIDAFKDQQILRSPDPLDDQETHAFRLSSDKFNFRVTNEKPFKRDEISEANVKHVESLFQDARFSNVPNFMYLPPVNKARPDTGQKVLLGHYPNLNQQEMQTYEDLDKDFLQKYINTGYEHVVEFTDTSTQNNVMSQMFEASDNKLKKLDIIEFVMKESQTDTEQIERSIFFAGKVFIDEAGNQTFLHMFTLIYES